MDGDVARQAPEPQRQPTPHQQESADGEQNQSADDQQFCEFTRRVQVAKSRLTLPGRLGPAPGFLATISFQRSSVL